MGENGLSSQPNKKRLPFAVSQTNVTFVMEKLTAWIKAERGRLAELAGACNITHAAILQWKRVPSDHLVAVERATGIPRQRLRPDLFEGMEA
jgi:hypothetical protein